MFDPDYEARLIAEYCGDDALLRKMLAESGENDAYIAKLEREWGIGGGKRKTGSRIRHVGRNRCVGGGSGVAGVRSGLVE
jgi:hypothetical protein